MYLWMYVYMFVWMHVYKGRHLHVYCIDKDSRKNLIWYRQKISILNDKIYKETHQMWENLIFLTLLEFHYLLIDVFLIEFLRRLMFFNFKLILHDEKMFKNWLVCNFFLFYWIKQVPTWCYPFIPVSSYEDAAFRWYNNSI